MRTLITGDAFKMARIFKQANIKNELMTLLKDAKEKSKDMNDATEKENYIEEIGMNAIFMIIEACGEKGIEHKLYEFLAPIWGVKPEEIEKMGLDTLIYNLKEMAKINNIERFFKLAGQLM